jgi:hypothetical protein
MAEQATYSTERLDHLGIVAGICHEIELIERIDILAGENDRKVSVRQAVQEMVLGKPVDFFIGEGLTAEDFNDDSLERALDRLSNQRYTKDIDTEYLHFISAWC